jgi:hypothetical protein
MEMKLKRTKASRVKQMDFVSRLTFVKGLKDAPKKFVYVKEKKKKKFKTWCMPIQISGYIKCRRYDFL